MSSFIETEIGTYPGSWDVNRVDSAFGIQQGKQVSKKNRIGINQRSFLRTKNVFWNRLDLEVLDQMHFTEVEESRLAMKEGDLLLCEGGDIGRAAMWRGEIARCYHQNHLHRLRALDGRIDPQYGVYWFWYSFNVAKLYFGRGNVTTIPNLSRSKLAELPMALPPLPEQKNIAHIFSAVQRAIETQERIIATTTELKKALMQKFFTEGLTGEPQKKTEIGLVPESWGVVPCEEVCEKITVGIVVKPSSYYVPDGVPTFRSQNVREDRLQLEPMVYISQEANDGPVLKSKLSAGDVLIVRTGYPGTSCVVPPEFDGSNCIDLVITRPDALKLRSHFLSRFFNSDAAKLQVLAGKIGLAQQHFNVGAVKRTLIPIPPKSEQDEIIANLELVDRKFDLAASKRNALQDLFRILLHELMTAKIRVHKVDLSELAPLDVEVN